MSDPYIIVTGTDLDGRQWARYGELDYGKYGTGAVRELACWMLSAGHDPARPVRIVNDNGGKLRSAPSLAALGRVK